MAHHVSRAPRLANASLLLSKPHADSMLPNFSSPSATMRYLEFFEPDYAGPLIFGMKDLASRMAILITATKLKFVADILTPLPSEEAAIYHDPTPNPNPTIMGGGHLPRE